MKKSNRINSKASIIIVLVIVLASLLYTYVLKPDKQNAPTSVDGVLSLHMIDVGQGDSLLLELNGQFMLVDAGPNSCEKDLISYLDKCGATELQYAVFTHPHEDHIGSGDAVLEHCKVDKVIMPDAETSTRAFESLLYDIEKEKCETVIPSQGDTFMLDNARITVLSLDGKDYEELNQYSIILRVDYGETSFLLTGDAETDNEKDILKSEYASLLDCDLLKVGHHGSVSSTGNKFLKKVSPDIAFISCGAGNDYGHPHDETVEKLSKAGIKIFRTDYCGSTVAESDGKNITIKTEF